jgi:hypothetical protein
VSADHNAFGKKTLRPALRPDLEDRLLDKIDLFHYCDGVEALLAELATKEEQAPSRNQIAAAEPVREAVTRALAGHEITLELMGAFSGAGGSWTTGSGEVHLEEMKFLDARRTVVYRVGEQIWSSTQAIWAARKDYDVTYVEANTLR